MTAYAGVEIRNEQFLEAQRRFDHAKAALNNELAVAFNRLSDIRQGDEIRVKVGMDLYIEGRAVVMRNGTRMGLFVETRTSGNNRERRAVSEPYADHVHLLPKKKAPQKSKARW